MIRHAASRVSLPTCLILAVAFTLLAACGTSSPAPTDALVSGSGATSDRSAAAVLGSGATLGPPAPDPSIEDSRGCISAQGLMGHLSVDTAQWSPNLDPFDPTVRDRVQTLSDDLARQVPLAQSAELRVALRVNAHAFALLSAAMRGKDKAEVTKAVEGTRRAYGQLKDLCQFDNE